MDLTGTAHFWGVEAPKGMWAALGADGFWGDVDPDGERYESVSWGQGMRADRQAAYVIELIERARDAIADGGGDQAAYSDTEIVRRAIAIYGGDRLGRAIQGLATAINGSMLRVKLESLPDSLASLLSEISEALVGRRFGG
jgi:hypothetical protein